MLRIKISPVREGSHPSEMVVVVNTADGEQERLVVDKRSLTNDTLGVGYPVGSEKDRLLVELPRETLSGRWRVWVPRESVVEGAVA